MTNIMRRMICLCFLLILPFCTVRAERSTQVDTDVSARLVQAKSGILTEASTGEVLYEWNPDERLPIASVTKTMTMLLIMEALENDKIGWDDMVTTSERASSMGGSQVFLEVGEQMPVRDMLKAIAVASGNDAAVAMAEYIGGSEEAFVETMNRRAKELGCSNTHFINCNGLNETTDHYSSARDIAIISRELLRHPQILDYTTIWMDTLRDGKFGLSNTNKLIRFYPGANGLKTGSTDAAKYCLAASAKRDDMQLIAVVLGAPSTKERFGSASAHLDFGFANYSVANTDTMNLALPPVPGAGGTRNTVQTEVESAGCIGKKGNRDKGEAEVQLPEQLYAPIKKGDEIGTLILKLEGEIMAKRPILAGEEVPSIGVFPLFVRLLKQYVCL